MKTDKPTPTDGPDLPAAVSKNGRKYTLTILKREYDGWWVIKYERADGSGRILEYTENPSLTVAEVRMNNVLNNGRI